MLRPEHTDCARCPVRALHFDGPEESAGQAKLATVAVRRKFRDRQTLFIEGHPASHVFLVRTGAVRLTRLLPDGSEVLLDFVSAGGAVGLDSLFASEHDATAIASGQVWCCAVPRADMRELLLASPGLSLALLRMTHKGLDDLRSRFADVTSPAEQRVARFLVGTLQDWKSNVPGFTQMDIARAVGLTPETLCRVLAQFRQRQWIDGRARGLTVTDAVPLRRLARTGGGD